MDTVTMADTEAEVDFNIVNDPTHENSTASSLKAGKVNILNNSDNREALTECKESSKSELNAKRSTSQAESM